MVCGEGYEVHERLHRDEGGVGRLEGEDGGAEEAGEGRVGSDALQGGGVVAVGEVGGEEGRETGEASVEKEREPMRRRVKKANRGGKESSSSRDSQCRRLSCHRRDSMARSCRDAFSTGEEGERKEEESREDKEERDDVEMERKRGGAKRGCGFSAADDSAMPSSTAVASSAASSVSSASRLSSHWKEEREAEWEAEGDWLRSRLPCRRRFRLPFTRSRLTSRLHCAHAAVREGRRQREGEQRGGRLARDSGQVAHHLSQDWSGQRVGKEDGPVHGARGPASYVLLLFVDGVQAGGAWARLQLRLLLLVHYLRVGHQPADDRQRPIIPRRQLQAQAVAGAEGRVHVGQITEHSEGASLKYHDAVDVGLDRVHVLARQQHTGARPLTPHGLQQLHAERRPGVVHAVQHAVPQVQRRGDQQREEEAEHVLLALGQVVDGRVQ